jgi:S-adenosylmethionine:tRNA ribosyltransferase-isomerase
MKLKDFDYSLPRELIAQEPLKERDSSRLMVLNRHEQTIEHSSICKLPYYIKRGDLLVANNTRVIPARLYGKKQTGGRAEVLLLRFLENGGAGAQIWECLINSRRKLKPQTQLYFSPALQGEVLEAAGGGRWRIKLFCQGGSFAAALNAAGKTPLPPYINRGEHTPSEDLDRERYQTVYAARDGAVAAPTAGLHFTQALMDGMRKAGAEFIFITLHVGLGTFQPIREETIEAHRMHEEFYHLEPGAAERINQTRRAGGRIICIGTTATRTLETMAAPDGTVQAGEGFTDLYIYPGYKFKAVDALITNFHLPRSSLLLLVSALAGHDLIQRAYAEAIRERYRFYSYGDAMLIM